MDLAKRIKQEALENAKQRQKDLENYDKMLQARKEARKLERQHIKAQNQAIKGAVQTSIVNGIEATVKTIQVQNLGEDFKEKLELDPVKVKKAQRLADHEVWKHRWKKLKDRSGNRRLKKIPPRPKKFIVPTKEYYGLDFTEETNNHSTRNSLSRKEELISLAKDKEEEYLKNPTQLNIFEETGNAFIAALSQDQKMNAMLDLENRKLKVDSKIDLLANVEKQQVTQKTTHDIVLRSKRESISQKVKIHSPEEETDQYVKSLQETKSTFEEASKTKIHWKSKVQRHQVDYSEFFAPLLKCGEGVYVYRLEFFKPVLLKKGAQPGTFCLGDCYLVLHKYYSEKNNLESKVYQWIGPDASIDKITCSAIFAVGLRNFVGSLYDIQREEGQDESDDFKRIFFINDLDLQYKEKSFAAASALYKVEEIEYPLYMYRVTSAKKNIRTQKEIVNSELLESSGGDTLVVLIEPDAKNMLSNHVYLIDNGLQIFQWNGKQSLLADRSKCRLLADRIARFERPSGKGRFFEIQEGDQEEEQLWEILQTERNPLDINTNEINVPTPNLIPKLFQNESIDELLYKGKAKPTRALLDKHGCAILDCFNELYLWVGEKSTLSLRQEAEEILITKIYPLYNNRPEYMARAKLMDGVESEVFKLRFKSWENIKVDYQVNPVPLKKKDDFISLEISALFTDPASGKYSKEEENGIEELFEKANNSLQSLEVFMFDSKKKKFIRLPEWTVVENDGREKGYFKELTEDDKEIENIENQDGDNKKNFANSECITYIWSGRHTLKPSFALLTFEFQFRGMLSKLVNQMTDGCLQVKSVFLEQEKESLAFIAHLNRECIIHYGKRIIDAENNIDYSLDIIEPQHVKLYHIRTESRTHLTRAVQTSPCISSFVTRDCFLLFYKKIGYLWVGRGASKEEERRSVSICNKLFQFNHISIEDNIFQIIRERAEPSKFWSYLAPDFKPPLVPSICYGQGFYYSLPPPRLFRCSTEKGVFSVVDCGINFTSTDLLHHSTSVCLLDVGPTLGKSYPLWVWIGKDASDVVIKLSKKAVETYFDHLKDGRSLDRSIWDPDEKRRKTATAKSSITGRTFNRADVLVIEQGNEPSEFRVLFLGWGGEYSISKEVNLNVEQMNKLYFQNSISVKREEPSNAFLRSEKERKQKLKEAKANKLS